MIRRRLAPFLGLLALLVAGCASDPVDPKDQSLSLVYGYIDMADAPSSLGWVNIKLYDGKNTGYLVSGHKGLFFHIGVEPGPYQVERFGRYATFFSNTDYTYNFGTRGRNESAIKVDKPGVYFMGTYKFVYVPTGWFEQDKFRMERTKTPTERELLTKVLTILQDDYPEYSRQVADEAIHRYNDHIESCNRLIEAGRDQETELQRVRRELADTRQENRELRDNLAQKEKIIAGMAPQGPERPPIQKEKDLTPGEYMDRINALEKRARAERRKKQQHAKGTSVDDHRA